MINLFHGVSGRNIKSERLVKNEEAKGTCIHMTVDPIWALDTTTTVKAIIVL